MAFNKFCATITNNCSTLKLVDTTGVYHVTTNPEGWNSDDTIEAGDLTAATIQYAFGDSTDYTTVDVLANIPDPVVGEFIIDEIDLEDYVDGVLTIIYTLTTATDSYVTKKKYFFACSARCCIDKFWVALVDDCSCELEDKLTEGLLMEGMYKAIMSGAACVKSEGRQKLLDKITKLCNHNKCNCD